jgi:hypothetical protein
MATKRPRAKITKGPLQGADTVDEFMRGLDHPLKPAVALVRSIILGASPRIAEGIKWNSPSFYVMESARHFATINTHRRAKTRDCVLIIFHRDAKVNDHSTPGVTIRDPSGLIEWLAKERCAARFYDVREVKAKKAALRGLVRQWIAQM